MAYRLKRREPVEAAVRRIADEQVGNALDFGPSAHEQIHEARKRCKKIRALLRFVRPALGKQYAVENAWYRDTARAVSQLRDAAALVECFDALMDRYADDVDRRRYVAIGDTLREQRDELAQREDLDAQLELLAGRLTMARARIADWTLQAGEYAAVGPGVRKTYKRGRKAMQKAYADPADEQFHEWRKRVKYHRYHLRNLRKVWKPIMKAQRKQVKKLSSLLGDDHDIAVLAGFVRENLQGRLDADAMLAFDELAAAQSNALRAEAHILGARVYAEKPKHLARKIAAWDNALAVSRTV